MREWIVPALGTFLCWALWSFIPKITVRYIDPKSAIFYESLAAIPIAVLVLASLRGRPESNPTGVVLAGVSGLVGFLGAWAYLRAVTRGPVTLIVSFTALYPALTIFLAWLFLHEPITLRQGAGIALALVAMVLVAV